VSKTSTLRAVVRDASGNLVRTLADGKLIHPTGTTAPHQVMWDGMRPGSLGPVVSAPGTYTLNVVFQPVDKSPSRLLSVPVLLQDSGVGKVAMTDFLDLADQVVTLNGQPLPFVQGETGFQWSAMASGKLYPPVDFSYDVQVKDAVQRVTAYPYMPFVTVAHRWFETVKVVPDMVFHTTFVRFGYEALGGWKKEIEFHRKPIFSQEHRFTMEKPSLTGTYKASFHCSNPDYGGKSDVDIEDMRVVVVIRAPDGTPMDTLRLPVHWEKWPEEVVLTDKGTPIIEIFGVLTKPSSKSPDLTPISYTVSEKGIFKGRILLYKSRSKHNVHIHASWEITLEEDMKYSRLNNRFYPWFGYVNASKGPKSLDFTKQFENFATLGFPYTEFFVQPVATYLNEIDKVYVLPQALSDTPTPTEIGAMIAHRYAEPVSANVGNDYRTYLEDERFELIVVNQSANGSVYTLSPAPGMESLQNGDKWKNRLAYTVTTNKTHEVLLPWPAALAADTVATLNERGEAVFKEVDSQRVEALNTLTGRLNKAKIDRLQLTPEMPGGLLTKQSEFLVHIPPDFLSEGSDKFRFSSSISLQDLESEDELRSSESSEKNNSPAGAGAGGGEKTIHDATLLSQVNAKLPQNVLTDRYTLAITNIQSVPEEGKDWMTLRFGNGASTIRADNPQPVILTMSDSMWGQAWNSQLDPVLKLNEGKLKGTVSGWQDPRFTPGYDSRVVFANAYPVAKGQEVATLNALYWENRSQNPHVVVEAWHVDPLLDGMGKEHPDLMVSTPLAEATTGSPSSSPGGVGASTAGASPHFNVGLRRAGAAQSFALLSPNKNLSGEAELSVRTGGAWESLGKLTLETPVFWNVARRQGEQTLRVVQGDRMATGKVFVGTPVKANSPAQVSAAYGRVNLDILAGTFSKDMLISVMPVRLDEIHISNMPDISDLDFMPIVEILPETASANFSKPVTLTYQYTPEEVQQISEGTYPGLARGVNLDNVQIYHISESGVLSPAETLPGQDRWIDRDGDGVLRSAGDVYPAFKF
jgi:hypothetical protein